MLAEYESRTHQLQSLLSGELVDLVRNRVNQNSSLCLMGNSRFGYIVLNSISRIKKVGFEPISYLIAPVVKLSSLTEFSNVQTNDQYDVNDFVNLKIIATTMEVDPRVNAENIKDLQKSVASSMFQLHVMSGSGHYNAVGQDTLNSFERDCIHVGE